MPDQPPTRKLIDVGDLGMEGDIPKDVTPDLIRQIPKQDDETHVSGSIKTKGVLPVGASVTIKGTF